MQILTLIMGVLLSAAAMAGTPSKYQAEAEGLLKKYVSIFDQGKHELIDEVFLPEFFESTGGKKKFLEGLKGLKPSKSTAPRPINVEVKDGHVNAKKKKSSTPVEQMYFARFSYTDKQGPAKSHDVWFVLKKDQSGHLRISGTMNSEGE